MDNRRLVIGMVVAMAIMLLWPYIVVFVGKQMGYDMTRRPAAPTTQQVATANSTGSPATIPVSEAPTTGAAATTAQASSETGLRLAPSPSAQPTALTQIGSALPNDPKFKMSVAIRPQSAGLEAVVLN